MKRKIAVITIILLLLGLLFYLKGCRKTDQLPEFTLQGETKISSGNIKIKVWDNNTEDDDTINVYFDGKLLKENVAIFNKPFVIELGNLSKGEYLLGVEAISEGIYSPASASLSLYNESEEQEFEMNATIKKTASWKINIQ